MHAVLMTPTTTTTVQGITIRNITGTNVELAGYINCPQGSNCTNLMLVGVQFAGAKDYVCTGKIKGDSRGCAPPTCVLEPGVK
jgi:hypothetical protein